MIAFAFALALGFSHHTGPQTVTRSTIQVGAWRVRVLTDSFAGTHTCWAKARRMRLENGVLFLQLGEHADTEDGLYRVDGGPAVPARTKMPLLLRRGYPVDPGDVFNPSGGLIGIAAEDVGAARLVQARATPKDRLQSFDVSRVAEVMAQEAAAGCPAPRA